MRSSTLHRIRERDEDFGSEEDQDAEEPVNGVDVDAGVGVGGQATTPAEGEQGVDSEEEDPVDREFVVVRYLALIHIHSISLDLV